MCQYFFATDLIAVKDAIGKFGNSEAALILAK
jgi:hypothetical protein